MKKSFFRFHKSIFIETLKRMKVPAIILAVAALMAGIFRGGHLFGYSAPAFVENPFNTAYFFACELIMLIVGIHVATSLHKKDTAELYGSVPVSRDSMWTTGFVAALVLGIGMMLVTFIGMLIGRLIMHDYFSIGSFGYNYLEVLPALGKTILFGIACYAVAVIACSVTNKVFSAIVTIIIVASFCMDTYFALSVESRFGLSLWELILPIDAGLRSAIGWIILAALTAAALFLSRKAFLKIRTEDNLPVKKGAVQIIVGVMLAANIMMMYVNIAAEGKVIVNNIIFGTVFSVIAYLIYSIIVCKKFALALKRFMFYPAAAAFCLIVYLGSTLFGKSYDKLDFSAKNIDYVEVTGNLIDDMNYYYSWDLGYSSGYTFGGELRIRKGSGKENKVRLDDSELKNYISKVMNSGWEINGYLNTLMDSLNFFYNNNCKLPICITLKDGTKYYTDARFASGMIDDTRNYILDFEAEYREALTDVTEFEGGHFLYMDKAFDDIYSLFIEELSALPAYERLHLMGHSSGYTPIRTSGVTVLRIANKDNTLVRSFMLSELTPKTLEKYCEISNKLLENDETKLAIEEIMSSGELPEYYTINYVLYDTVTHEAFCYSIRSADEYISERIISYDLFKEYFEPYLFEGEDIEARYDEYVHQHLSMSDYIFMIDNETFKEMFDFGDTDEDEITELLFLYLDGYYSEIGSQYPNEERIKFDELDNGTWEFFTGIAENKDENSRCKLIITSIEVELYSTEEGRYKGFILDSSFGDIVNEYPWTWNLSDEQYETLIDSLPKAYPGAEAE